MVDVAARIEQMRFTPVRVRSGYDMNEVDELLDRAVDAWRSGSSLVSLVESARFTQVRFREGYVMAEVDEFLEWLRQAPLSPTPGVAGAALTGSAAVPGDLVRRIRDQRFTPVRFREGYDMADVDQLLDELVAARRAGRSLAPLIDAARFARVRVREGYDVGEVDQFLDELRRTP